MFVNVVFSQCMFDVIDFLLVFPFFVQLMDLTGHVALLSKVEGPVNFGESAFADQSEEKISLVKNVILIESRMIFVVETFQFSDVNISLSIESFEIFGQIGFFAFQGQLPQTKHFVVLVPVLQCEERQRRRVRRARGVTVAVGQTIVGTLGEDRLAVRQRWTFEKGFPLRESLPFSIERFFRSGQLFLGALFVEKVRPVDPLFDEGRALTLSDKLTETKSILHRFLSDLFLL